jgi:hypothetical protein
MPDARCSVTRRSRWGAIAPRSSMTSEPPSSAPHVDHDQVMQGINAVLGADYREKLRLSAFTEHNATTYTYTPNTSMKDAIQPRQWRRKGSVGSVVSVVEGAPPTEEPRPDASNARSQRPATRATGVSRALVCVLKHPWFPTSDLHCPGHPSCAGA